MKTINQLLTKVSKLEQVRDPLKFCKVGSPEEINAMPKAEKAEYQIIMIVSEEVSGI